jgi:CheY-like chemotaxis protein
MTDDMKNRRTGTVLIVDDDQDYLAQMAVQFASRGYRVLTADSRKGAEEILAAERPDIAILDLMMENSDDGFMLSYSLKKRYPDVPVVLVTAVTSETGYEFSEKLGASSWIRADGILSKPVRFEQVIAEIDRLVTCGE